MAPVADRVTELVQRRIEESVAVQQRLLDRRRLQAIADAAEAISSSIAAGGKLLIFGNGGSAADADHLAGEFVGRYLLERRALPAIALTTQTAGLTAVANDYSYDDVFARQIEALGVEGDVALAISTSGTSPNVVAGVDAAKARGMATLALTGASGGALAERVDVCIHIPSEETPRIQEGHALVGHIVCELAEAQLTTDRS